MTMPAKTSDQHDNAMRAELELHAIWSLPPTLILFTLLVADRSLRARFEADVAGILIEFGLSSPKHLIGLSERHCPVMPRIPVDAEVADDIRHPFWSKWLEGAIPQLDNFGTRATRLPDRETISDADWNWLVTRAKNAIREKAAVIERKEPKARKPPQTKLAPQRRFHLINASLPKCGSSWLASLFRNYRSAHEFAHEATNTKILNWQNELISEEELAGFFRSRDETGLDVDSCTSTHLIAGSLAAWFPEAQFVHCHRAFSRWATSWMAMVFQETSRASLAGDTVSPWWKRYARLLVPGLDLQDLNEFENLPKMIQGLTPSLAKCWGQATQRVLTSIPNDRLLVLDTRRLDDSHQIIADFVGVPVDTLCAVTDADKNEGGLSASLRSMIDLEELEAAGEPWTTRCKDLITTHSERGRAA